MQSLTAEELSSLDPLRARDLVVRCFYAAQHETFERAAKSMHAIPTEVDLKKTIEGAVRLAFRSAKGDFENPTAVTLQAAVEILAAKAAAMGTPPDIIEHHRTELARVFAALRPRP